MIDELDEYTYERDVRRSDLTYIHNELRRMERELAFHRGYALLLALCIMVLAFFVLAFV